MDTQQIPVDINTLIQTSDISIYNKNKLIDKLQKNFSEDEQKLYVCNLFLYLNNHPTKDFIINLDNMWKFIGFSNKGNAKRLLQQHFKENVNYKKLLLRTEKQVYSNKNLGGAGLNQETIMLNINTFKKLCLKANTENADKIHDYYIKLEMLYNELMKEQLEETQKLLEKEKREKALIQNRRWIDVKPCETIYVYKDNMKDNLSQIKIGKSKDLSQREKEYSNLNKSGGIVYFKKVLNCTLAERVCHHILDKYRINRQQEWFNISEHLATQTIDMVSCFLDNSIDNIPQFIELHKGLVTVDETDNEINENKQQLSINTLNTKKNYQDFLTEMCSIGETNYTFKDELRMAFRIWSKSTDKKYVNEFLSFINEKYSSGVEYKDTVRKNVYRGFSLDEFKYTVDNADEPKIYEEFILSKCQVGWGCRISYADFFETYTAWMKEKDPLFKLNMIHKKEIQEYLEKKFAGGRVHLSQKTKTTHLFGVWGLSLHGENGIRPKKLTRKRISKCSTNDDTIIQTWDSLSIASKEVNIPRSTLSVNIRFKKLFDDGYYFKFL